jgi:hypothetical protein
MSFNLAIGTALDSKPISSYGTIKQLGTDVSWLHTSEMYIYDSSGQRINLYAMNVAYGDGSGISLSDIQKIKALGFNAFRIFLYWDLMQPYNETMETIDQSYFTNTRFPLGTSVDQVINWATQENMYVITVIVWTPTWTPPSWAFPGVTNDDQRFTALFNGTATREITGLTNCYSYIANRYKEVPNIIFELLNEPCVLDSSLAGTAYKTFNENITTAIESAETTSHLKIVELLTLDPIWEEIVDTIMDIDKPNVVWATHYYAPMNSWDPKGRYYHGSFTWNGQYFPEGWGNGTTYVAWRIIRCVEKIHSWNKPWINTEFSKIVTQADWIVWFNTVLETMADNNITGWTLHQYSSNPSAEWDWNINNPTVQLEIMNVIRPYMTQQ